MRKRIFAAAAAVPFALAGIAGAVRNPEWLDERPLEIESGPRGRAGRDVVWDRAPAGAGAAWADFLAAQPGTWRVQWDATTEVPLRIWGEGIAVPGAMASDAIALAAARGLLERHLALLAPGASIGDFEVVSNVSHGKGGAMRTVGFAQRWRGLEVVGGQVSFLFKRDRVIVIGSEAIPAIAATAPARVIDDARAREHAAAWIADLYGNAPVASAVGAPVVLPLIRDRDDGVAAVSTRVVVPVTVDSADPVARWQVFVDAGTGAPVARAQTLRFADGTVRYKVPVRGPTRPRMDYPAAFGNFRISSQTVASDANGKLTWSGTAAAQVTTALTGPFVAITNRAGSLATATLSLPAGGSVVWDQSTSEQIEAQLTGFIHANLVKQFVRSTLNPNLPWLDRSLSVSVNESGSCNAYSTGDDIHFYRSSNQCENTGRIADVIYHEFGHSLHDQSIIPGAGSFEGALSEGVSDYLAATIVNDSGMGRGFLRNDNALRELDPVGTEKRWPDDRTGEVHDDGEIIAGTLWDLRKAMIGAHGMAEGVARADDLYYAIIQRASDIPSSYPEALAADDDDGNLANGTPNSCLITQVFAAHGMASGDVPSAIGIGRPERDGFRVALPIEPPTGDCPTPTVQTAKLEWKVRGGAAQEIALSQQGQSWAGTIPTQADGTVVQYRVSVALSNGSTVTYPQNAADPMYEFFVGPVVELYCARMDTDPGWTHGAVAGTDDWAWRAPIGAGGDPMMAFTGANVFGTDLGGGSGAGADGQYEPSSDTWARTPEIDTTGYTNVRLHYRRWLGVEDGFFDKATISVDGQVRWTNLNSNMGNNSATHHEDKEWRFQDVDLSADAADGKVQITFALKSDQGLEKAGWNLDDVCVVAYVARAETCGNGTVDSGEQCDDGNVDPGDGCDGYCRDEPPPPGCGDGTVAAPEACDDGNTANGDGCSSVCTVEEDPQHPADGDATGGCCSTGDRGGHGAGAFALGALVIGALRRRRRRRA